MYSQDQNYWRIAKFWIVDGLSNPRVDNPRCVVYLDNQVTFNHSD